MKLFWKNLPSSTKKISMTLMKGFKMSVQNMKSKLESFVLKSLWKARTYKITGMRFKILKRGLHKNRMKLRPYDPSSKSYKPAMMKRWPILTRLRMGICDKFKAKTVKLLMIFRNKWTSWGTKTSTSRTSSEKSRKKSSWWIISRLLCKVCFRIKTMTTKDRW